jgi:hypothetical protein
MPAENLGAGTYTATVTVGGAGANAINIGQESFGISFTVSSAPLTVRVDNQSIIYGAAAPEFTVTYTGIVSDDDINLFASHLNFTHSYSAGSSTGTYPVTLASFTLLNYNVSSFSGTLTVTPRPLTIGTVTVPPKQYDGGVSIPSGTVTAVVDNRYGSDDVSAMFTGSAEFTSANVGTGVAVQFVTGGWILTGAPSKIGNYVLSQPSPHPAASGSITSRPLTVVANDKLIGVGSAQPVNTYSLLGLVKSDLGYVTAVRGQLTVAFALDRTFSSSVPGVYTITPTAAVNQSAGFNYTVSNRPGTLTVTTSSIVSIVFEGGSAVYDGTPKPHATALYGGSGDGFVYTYSGMTATGAVHSPPSSPPVDAGVYQVTATYHREGYTGSATVDFVITPRPLTVLPGDIVYDGKVYDGTRAIEGGLQIALSAVLAGDAVTVSYESAQFDDPNAGLRTVVVSGLGLDGIHAGNYALTGTTASRSGVVIQRRNLMLKADDMVLPLGAGLPPQASYTFALDGLVPGETHSVITIRPSFELRPAFNSASEGVFTIISHSAHAANYDISYFEATLTVTGKNILSSSRISFGSGFAVYDGTPKPHETARFEGSADNITYIYSGISAAGVPYPPTSVPPTNAGVYEVTARYEDHTDVGLRTVTFTVRPKPLALSMFRVDTLTYIGEAFTPVPVAADGANTVTFEISRYLNNAGVGMAYIDVVGVGNYTGSLRVPFVIKGIYTLPEGLTAVYGQLLLDIDLTIYGEGWAWMDASASVGGAGVRTHYLTYTSAEYGVVLPNIGVAVDVARAARNREGVVAAMVSLTNTSVTMYSAEDPGEGRQWEYSADGVRWQDSPVFTGLMPNTQYAMSVRIKGDNNHMPSDAVVIFLRMPTLEGAPENGTAENDSPPQNIYVRERAETPAAPEGILLDGGAFASGSVSFTVAMPRAPRINVAIYDNMGNAVFRRAGVRNGERITWDLTNSAGRAVSSGSYMIVAAGRGTDGAAYRESAMLRVRRQR